MPIRNILILLVLCVALAWGTAYGIIDTDGDLLPDTWEDIHSLDKDLSTDADLDSDGDRFTNRDEFFAGTDPRTYNAVTQLKERAMLDMLKGQAFVFFWEQSRPPYYFTADSADYKNKNSFSDNFNSIATTGFSLVSYVVADENDWIDHALAYQRIETLLTRAVELQASQYNVLSGDQGNRYGYLYHFVTNQGFKALDSEISSIDHALFVAGALIAGEYYKGTRVALLARQLYENTDWDWMYNGTFLHQGWFQEPGGTYDGGRLHDEWNRYSELLILLFLAMGNPNTNVSIPASAWDNLTYGYGRMFPFETTDLSPNPADAPQHFAFVPNMPNSYVNPSIGYKNSATKLHYIHAGSLHNHQYSHLFTDFRGRIDRYQTDFFANSISATLANREFCINLNEYAFGGDPDSTDYHLQQPYDTYSENCWGLMAGIPAHPESWQPGYKVMQPIIMDWEDFGVENIAVNNDSGTVLLSAPLGSTPFTARQTMDFLRYILTRYQADQPDGFDQLLGRYGFMNSFNNGLTYYGQRGHYAPKIIGLDMGPVVSSIENFQTGLIWNLGLRSQYIAQGMQAAGFTTGPVEPFVIDFDDDPPAPQEDPNGGGVDPNSFGGSTYTFGSGAVAYEFHSDPFPGVDYGPQEYVLRLETSDDNDSGAFITLNNHGVSRWGRLSFWIKGYNGGEDFSIGMKDSVTDRLGNPIESMEIKLPIKDYHPDGTITDEWTAVIVPLQDFIAHDIRVEQLDNISFTSAMSEGGTIFVDDIAFLPDEQAPSAPTGLELSRSGANIIVTWNENPESDVVGYRIYRSVDGGTTYVLQNAFIIPETTYATTLPGSAITLYYITAVDNAAPQNESAPSESISSSVNTPPAMNPVADRTVNEGTLLTFTVQATDPDAGDTLTLEAELANGSALDTIGASFVDNGNRTGTFTWTPGYDQGSLSGTDYNAMFIVSDLIGDTDQVMATITVLNVNQAPIANAGTDHTAVVGSTVTLNGSNSYDPDGDTITYLWNVASTPGDVEITLSDTTAAMPTFTPTVTGPYVFSLTVADGSLSSTSATVTVTIVHDYIVPEVTISEPTNNSTLLTRDFILSGTATDTSGIADVRVYVYDYADPDIVTVVNAPAYYDEASDTWSFHVLPEHVSWNAYCRLFVRAQDNAGNWSKWRNILVYFDMNDTTPPVVSVTAPLPNTRVSDEGFSFHGAVSDPSGIKDVRVYVYDYGNATIITAANAPAVYDGVSGTWSLAVTADLISANNYARLFVRALDNAGNWSRWLSVLVYVERSDILPPTIQIDQPAGTVVSSTGFTAGGLCNDASGIAEVRVYVYDYGLPEIISVADAEAVYYATEDQWSFAVAADDISSGYTCRIFVRAKDNAGNWSKWRNKAYWVE